MTYIPYNEYKASLQLIINFCRFRKIKLRTYVEHYKIKTTPVENYSPFFSPSDGSDDRSSSDSTIVKRFGKYVKITIVPLKRPLQDNTVFFQTLVLIKEIEDYLPDNNIEDLV